MHSFLALSVYISAAFVVLANASTDHYILSNVLEMRSYVDRTHTFSFHLEDPNTSTQTKCQLKLDGLGSFMPPTWNNCTDATFTWKFDSYYVSNNLMLEFKHQYRGKGKPCVQSNGQQCTTSRAYFNLMAESFTSDPGSSSAGYNKWEGPFNATIFTTCELGCGLTSGDN